MQQYLHCFMLCAATCLILTAGCQSEPADSADYHFSVINSAREQVDDREKHADQGFQLVDPTPSLAWLVANNHIQYRDLVLPNVDRRAGSMHWMAWGLKYLSMPNPDVLWIESHMHHADLPITGDQPLHFQIWYRNDAEEVVIELIQELEALPKN